MPLIYRPELEQRAYVQDFIDKGAPSGFLYIEGQKQEQIMGVVYLAAHADWVIPMLEARTKAWMMEYEANRESITNASSVISSAGGRQGLDAIIRLYNGRPELDK